VGEDKDNQVGKMAKGLNILLVSPKSYDEAVDQKLTGNRLFPYSIVYLVNYLKRKNLCNVDYLDLVMEPTENLYRRISAEHFDLIGFTSTAEARFCTIDKIKKVKDITPETKIVTGGYFFSKTADEALRNVPEIDYIVRGEGELTLAHLVRALSEGDPNMDSIDGLSFRSGETIVHNPDRKPDPHLDQFLLDYDLIWKPGYDLLFPMKNLEEREEMKAFPIMLGRGCNQRCIFCLHRHLPYRTFKLEQIMAQIDWVMKKAGTQFFMFTDPSFSERQQFVKDLCQYLINHNYNIQWYCEVRADVPLDLLRLMNRAGCISVDFALESGSERVLQALNKRLSLKELKHFSRTCHQLGIRANFFTMVSLPEERESDFLKTYQMIKTLYKYGMQTSIAPLIIYPGTDLERLAKARGIIPEHFSWFDREYQCPHSFVAPRENNMPHYLEHLTERQILSYMSWVSKFYWRKHVPKLIAKRIRHFLTIRSKKDCVEFATLLKSKIVSMVPPKWTRAFQKRQRTQQKLLMYPPYPLTLYANLLQRFEERTTDRKDIHVFIRHDVDTAACIQKLNCLLAIDREFQVPAGLYFRIDDVEYRLPDYKDWLNVLRQEGFEIGLHTVCYLDDNPLQAFQRETAKFEREVGFRPRSFSVHGLGTFRAEIRMRFYRDISNHLKEFGYVFGDVPQLRPYEYVIQDCHLDEEKKIFICDDVKEPFPFRKGKQYLILTHPCYWEG
jgi:anaerobic magnesium-protoporphyrin IX monomethyl ester cyclase